VSRARRCCLAVVTVARPCVLLLLLRLLTNACEDDQEGTLYILVWRVVVFYDAAHACPFVDWVPKARTCALISLWPCGFTAILIFFLNQKKSIGSFL